MDIHELRTHIDTRLDRVEGKLDAYAEQAAVNKTDIGYLRVGLAFVISIIVAVCGYLAAGFFEHLTSK